MFSIGKYTSKVASRSYSTNEAMQSQTQNAVQAYRNLMRTHRQVFDQDLKSQQTAIAKTREAFQKNKSEKDAQKIAQLLKEADEVNQFLKKNIIQAVPNEKGAYQLKVTKDTEILGADGKPVKVEWGKHRKPSTKQ